MKFLRLLLKYLNRKSNNLTIIRYNSKSQIATKSAIVFAVVYNFYSYFKKQKANSNESYFQDYNSLKPQFQLLPVLHARERNKNLKEEAVTTIVDKETEVKVYFLMKIELNVNQ
jgi:hypothetical protein